LLNSFEIQSLFLSFLYVFALKMKVAGILSSYNFLQ